MPQDLVSRVVDQYDTAVAHADQATGELLDRLRKLDLYDLEEDPGETRNLVTERPEVAQDLARRLPEQLPPAQRAAPAALPAPVDAEEAAQLRALGYAE